MYLNTIQFYHILVSNPSFGLGNKKNRGSISFYDEWMKAYTVQRHCQQAEDSDGFNGLTVKHVLLGGKTGR